MDLDEAALERAAETLGGLLRGGEVLLLFGELGAGKTTFVRALARGLCVDDPRQVRSPSFTLCMVHEGPRPLVHVDLFRLGDPAMAPAGAAGFEALGLPELAQLGEAGQVLAVEWAELWRDAPKEHLEIRLARAADRPGIRTLSVSAGGPASEDLRLSWLRALEKAD